MGARFASNFRLTVCFRYANLPSHFNPRSTLHASRSSSGLGHRPFTAATRVRLPYGTPLTQSTSYGGDCFKQFWSGNVLVTKLPKNRSNSKGVMPDCAESQDFDGFKSCCPCVRGFSERAHLGVVETETKSGIGYAEAVMRRAGWNRRVSPV